MASTSKIAKRLGSVIKLKPESYEKYKELHAAVWPKVIRRYLIWSASLYPDLHIQFEATAADYRFLEPSFFRPSRSNSKQESFPSPQSNAVICPRFFEPIFVSLGGSKNRDSTVFEAYNWYCVNSRCCKEFMTAISGTTPFTTTNITTYCSLTWNMSVSLLRKGIISINNSKGIDI